MDQSEGVVDMGRMGMAILLLALGGTVSLHAECTESEPPPAGHAAFAPPAVLGADTAHWGYGYDSLLRDLEEWRKSPYVKVDSIGATVQGRAIWSLAITEGGDSVGRPGDADGRKRRVFVHARTHPAEVQAFHISRSMISQLLDGTEEAREIRRDFIFNIIPMYNPDGVELGFPRENANRIDIESNWNKAVLEPEVAALKRHFQFLMASPVPVEVALNLHSDRYNCTRFFFFHEAGGTSAAYAELEKDFIGKVRAHFASGIEEWHFVTSWPTATGTQYPEGFWWLSHREKVMALTYEDANCPGAGMFDSTARALLRGSADYLASRPVSLVRFAREETRLLREGGGWRVLARSGEAFSGWTLRDAAGRRLDGGGFRNGGARIPAPGAAAGAMVLTLARPAGRAPLHLLLPALAP